MKYQGNRISGQGGTVYSFAFGKEELEILLRLSEQAYENTPKVFEVMQYRSRLRQLTLELGKVWAKEVKSRVLSTKPSQVHKSIKRNLK